MNTPQDKNRPTHQELMEFVDGTLSPSRFRDVEQQIAQSRRLQSEVKLLQAMRLAIVNEPMIHPSKKFTAGVIQEILPVRQESLWLRLVKNSSNLFAMVLVISMIGIVLAVGPGKRQNDANIFTTTIESYAVAYDTAIQQAMSWTKQVTQPAGHAVTTPSGKFLLMGLAIFILAVIADDIFNKRYFHARLKR